MVNLLGLLFRTKFSVQIYRVFMQKQRKVTKSWWKLTWSLK